MAKPTYFDLTSGSKRSIPAPDVSERYERVDLPEGQRLGVSVYNEGDDKDTIVQFLAWSGYASRPDEIQRGKVMAAALDATLVTVDNPGVGLDNSFLSRPQLNNLRNGAIEELSAMQVAALERVKANLADISLFGYSLGTVMASAAMAHLPSETRVKKLALIEPVAIEKTSVPELSLAFMLDGLKDGGYKVENPDWYRQHKEVFPTKQIAALYRYVQFMANNKGFVGLDSDGVIAHGADTTVVSAENSRVTSLDNAKRLASRLSAEHWVMQGENHSMLNGLGRITLLLEMLREHDRL